MKKWVGVSTSLWHKNWLSRRYEFQKIMIGMLTDIPCSNCPANIKGYSDEILMVDRRYSIVCPECSKITTFNGVASFINVNIPSDAVKIEVCH